MGSFFFFLRYRADLYGILKRRSRNQSAVKVRVEHKMPMLRTSSGAHKRRATVTQFPREYQFGKIRFRGGRTRVSSPWTMPFLHGLLDGAAIRARVHRVILAGPRKPASHAALINLVRLFRDGRKKSERASERGAGGTRQKGGTRWVVINGEAI